MNAAQRSATIALKRADELTSDYLRSTPGSAGALTVITDRAAIDARSRDLHSKLIALGITDISTEGRLVLGGPVAITPGVRRGVPLHNRVDTSIELDLDTLPEMFTYTRSGRPVVVDSVGSSNVGAGAGAPSDARPSLPGTDTRGLVVAGSRRLSAGRSLVMSPAPVLLIGAPVLRIDEAIIVAEELQLQDGTQLVIAENTKYLTILVQRLTLGSDVEIIWEAKAAETRGRAQDGQSGTSYNPYSATAASAFSSPDGGDGQRGGNGLNGYPGDDAPTLEIWGLDVTALPAIHLQGGNGGIGQRGGNGGKGGDGAKGLQSHSMVWGCDRTVGYGGDGGDGGDGGRSGGGGRGGRGGDLRLYLTDASHTAVLAAGLVDNRAGGPPGDAGEPGNGGRGGIGGEAGDPDGVWCGAKPERAGRDGSSGEPGVMGIDSPQGDTGHLTAVVISPDEFHTKWTAPQVRTVTPWEVESGDVVTISGANFTTNAYVRFGSTTTPASFIADTILQAVVPALPTGWTELVVHVPEGESSNPGSVKVLSTIVGVTPNPAAIGNLITITGAGFVAGSRVLFRGQELDPATVASDGSTVTVVLPAPQGPFEDWGGTESIAVRNPDGVTTRSIDLVLRHVLSTGFNVARNGYSFTNGPVLAPLADMGTFQDTYGPADVVTNFLLEPVLTGAWYLFYRSFFNVIQPGYSSGFSTTAADEYWSGNPNLFSDFAALPAVERLLTIAQGHILSREMLTKLAAQALAGAARAATSLAEIEFMFRAQIGWNDELRRESAPIVQLIPAGTVTTSGFVASLGISHGLLPIRVEYPVNDETWERRVAVYDNAGAVGVEAQLVFTRTAAGLAFVLTPDPFNRTTASGWTLSQASLLENWLSDVSMPSDYMFILSPATVVIEDEEGRKFGVRGKKAWSDLPDVLPAIGAPNLYLLPLDRNLTFSVAGTGTGTYTLGIVAGSLGRSITLVDVPVTPETRDVVRIGNGLRDIVVESGDTEKELTLHYGVAGVRQARALKVANARVGTETNLTLRFSDDLSRFEIQGDGPDHHVSIALSAADRRAAGRHTFDSVAVSGQEPRAFNVSDWKQLGPASLQPAP